MWRLASRRAAKSLRNSARVSSIYGCSTREPFSAWNLHLPDQLLQVTVLGDLCDDRTDQSQGDTVEARVRSDVAQGRPPSDAVAQAARRAPKARKTKGSS